MGIISSSFDFGELRDFQKKLENLEAAEKEFAKRLIKGLAARLLGSVIKETPVGRKPSFDGLKNKAATEAEKHWEGYTGGTLRRGWIAKTEDEAKAKDGTPGLAEQTAFVNSLPVDENGGDYSVTLINPVKYATYVENGHRQSAGRFVPALGKKLVSGWVAGVHMVEKSENALRPSVDSITEKAFEKFLKEYFNG